MPDFYPPPTARAWDDFAQYVPLLLGACDAELMRPDAWEADDREDALLYIDDLKTYLLELPRVVQMASATEITLAPVNMTISSGTLNIQMDSLQRNGCYWQQSSPANGQTLDADRHMAAGQWAYRISLVKTSNSGIALVQVIDANSNITTIGTHDFRNAGGVLRNQYYTGTFTLPKSGMTRIHIGVNGTNASPAAYFLLITLIEMWRTGD